MSRQGLEKSGEAPEGAWIKYETKRVRKQRRESAGSSLSQGTDTQQEVKPSRAVRASREVARQAAGAPPRRHSLASRGRSSGELSAAASEGSAPSSLRRNVIPAAPKIAGQRIPLRRFSGGSIPSNEGRARGLEGVNPPLRGRTPVRVARATGGTGAPSFPAPGKVNGLQGIKSGAKPGLGLVAAKKRPSSDEGTARGPRNPAVGKKKDGGVRGEGPRPEKVKKMVRTPSTGAGRQGSARSDVESRRKALVANPRTPPRRIDSSPRVAKSRDSGSRDASMSTGSGRSAAWTGAPWAEHI